MAAPTIPDHHLPADLDRALLVGRVWRQAPQDGPCVVAVRGGRMFDITAVAPTMADLLERPDRVELARLAPGEPLGDVRDWLASSLAGGPARLLAPCDLQPVKAAGVTFAVSLLERLIEEEAGGDAGQAEAIRERLQGLIGSDLSRLRPGSAEAMALKEALVARGQWSQYLEVGIGPDAEVFSKAPPMASVGYGARIGVLPESRWNNPEPELVLAVDSRGQIVGATLGNDVNLRDVEGRSALLLTRAKDNNGSCAIGPFIRLFDADFTLDSVRAAEVALRIDGPDGFSLAGVNLMSQISRDPLDLVRQTLGAHHQYPDGCMLFLGTMFSPTQDRHGPGSGFTHAMGDRVEIASGPLGALVNEVGECTAIAPWDFGLRALYASLARRGCWRGRHGLRSGRGAGRSRGPAWPACHATVCEPRSGWLEQGARWAGQAWRRGRPTRQYARAPSRSGQGRTRRVPVLASPYNPRSNPPRPPAGRGPCGKSPPRGSLHNPDTS